MNLNPYSWHAYLYRYTYGKEVCELPKSLCTYFWKLVLAIIIFIPGYPGIILKLSFSRKDWDHKMAFPIIGMILNFFVIISGTDRFHISTINKLWSSFWLVYGWGWIIIGLVIASMICLFFMAWLASIISDAIKSKREIKPYNYHKPDKTYILFEFTKAFFNKYCPKIQWKQSSVSSSASPSEESSAS